MFWNLAGRRYAASVSRLVSEYEAEHTSPKTELLRIDRWRTLAYSTTHSALAAKLAPVQRFFYSDFFFLCPLVQ